MAEKRAFLRALPVGAAISEAEVVAVRSRGADAGAFEDDGEAAAGVGAAADEVDAVEVLEAVAGAEVEHLG